VKVGAAQMQVQGSLLALAQIKDGRDQWGVLRWSSIIWLPSTPKPVRLSHRLRWSAQAEMADAALGQSDQTFTDGRMDAITDGQTEPARFVFSGSDRLRGEKIMEASQARKSDLIGGVQQVSDCLSNSFALPCQILEESLWLMPAQRVNIR